MSGSLAYPTLMMLVISSLQTGCNDQIGDYNAASSISKNGFAINGNDMLKAHGREIRLWGFVDHNNLYGNDNTKKILEEQWSGYGPNPAAWIFNLKAKKDDDEAGHSFSVRVPDDPERDELLKVFLADARARRPTKVFVKGKIFTFDAPTNANSLTGLYMEL